MEVEEEYYGHVGEESDHDYDWRDYRWQDHIGMHHHLILFFSFK